MDHPISIIVPVYNGEAYLADCVDSVLAQTSPHWELVLVDDGSTDGTPAICDSYRNDPRIHVFHQPNKGVTSARLKGVELASGEHVLFVDADDALSPDMVASVEAVVSAHHPDCVLTDYLLIRPHEVKRRTLSLSEGMYQGSAMRNAFFPTLFHDEKTRRSCIGTWMSCKLFRKDWIVTLLRNVDPSVTYGEDFLAVIPYALRCDSLYYLKRPLFEYRIHAGQMTRRYSPRLFPSLFILFPALEQTAEEADRAWPGFAFFTQVLTYERDTTLYAIKNQMKHCPLSRIERRQLLHRLYSCGHVQEAMRLPIPGSTPPDNRILLLLYKLHLSFLFTLI